MKAQSSEIGLAASLLGLVPLMAMQAAKLWERPHFQFFPLAWLVLAVFAFKQLQKGGTGVETAARRRIGIAVWIIGLLAGLAAAVLVSPWLAHVATGLVITAWGLQRLVSVSWTRWLGWTSLVWVSLPLPGALDRQFISELQGISSRSTSSLLDLAGFIHLRQGNVIEIRSGQLFVDEACSGVDSLYSLIAITLVMVLWQRRPLIVAVLAIASVPIWAWLGNVLRLTTIILMLDYWSIDLSHGWKHTLLGLVMFGLSSLCLFGTLESLAELFRRFSMNTMPTGPRSWHNFYNRLVCFPGNPPELLSEEDQYFHDSKPTAINPLEPQGTPSPPPELGLSLGNWSFRLGLPVFIIGGLIGVASVWGILRNNALASLSLPHFEVAKIEEVFNLNSMPDAIMGAKRTGFEDEVRPRDNFAGEYSRTWRYSDELGEFMLSVDFPFRGFHALWVCYESAGQTARGEPKRIALPGRDDSNVALVKFEDQVGSFSYLWFRIFDAKAKAVPIGSYELGVRELMTDRFRTSSLEIDQDPITYQFQLYLNSGKELSDLEIERMTRIFTEALPHAERQVKLLSE